MATPSCSRSVGRMRALNSSSDSTPPFSGRNCHWFRNSAVSLMYPAMSSIEMPFATRDPMNGGVKIGVSTATSERAGISTAGAAASRSLLRGGSLRPPASRPNAGSSSPDFLPAMSVSMVRRPSNASLP